MAKQAICSCFCLQQTVILYKAFLRFQGMQRMILRRAHTSAKQNAHKAHKRSTISKKTHVTKRKRIIYAREVIFGKKEFAFLVQAL